MIINFEKPAYTIILSVNYFQSKLHEALLKFRKLVQNVILATITFILKTPKNTSNFTSKAKRNN